MLGTNVYACGLGVVFLKRSILDLEQVYINGRRRELLVGMVPKRLRLVLVGKEVEVAVI